MARLYSDLIDSGGRRYYFGLNSAAGGISNANTAGLQVIGYAAEIFQQIQVFRTPATATLTVNGQPVQAYTNPRPALAALTLAGQIPGEQKQVVITNALPPDYTALPDNVPTILQQHLLAPNRAQLSLQTLEVNLTQGGNIVTIMPGVGVLTAIGYGANFPRLADIGLVQMVGQIPTLHLTIVVEPETAQLSLNGAEAVLGLPFVWVDDAPAAPTAWIDDPRA